METILNDDEDPVLQMWGVGKAIWKEEGGDAFIARERAALDIEMEARAQVLHPRMRK